MTAVNQHYVPKFLQRRFGLEPTNKKTKVARLEKSTGEFRLANPRNEAAERHYYRMIDEDGKIDDGVEEWFASLEDGAARVIGRLVQSPPFEPTPEDLVTLAMFVATMRGRTPTGRAGLADTDVEMAKVYARRLFSDVNAVKRALGPTASDHEVVEMRQRLIDDLKDGRIYFESTPTREVGLLFSGLSVEVEWLFSKADWTVLLAPTGRQFILSDAPVAHYDPTPKFEGAGVGLTSSPGAMTFLPIDPQVMLMLRPSTDGLLNWHTRRISPERLDKLNLLIYAQADRAIFGRSESIVTEVAADARDHADLIAELARRCPCVWVAEIGPEDRPGKGGVRTFRSTNRDGTVARQLYVDPAAERDAQQRAV